MATYDEHDYDHPTTPLSLPSFETPDSQGHFVAVSRNRPLLATANLIAKPYGRVNDRSLGIVYAASCPVRTSGRDLVKIGWTRSDVPGRVRSIVKNCEQNVEQVFITTSFVGAYKVEQIVHSILSYSRYERHECKCRSVNGEWFDEKFDWVKAMILIVYQWVTNNNPYNYTGENSQVDDPSIPRGELTPEWELTLSDWRRRLLSRSPLSTSEFFLLGHSIRASHLPPTPGSAALPVFVRHHTSTGLEDSPSQGRGTTRQGLLPMTPERPVARSSQSARSVGDRPRPLMDIGTTPVRSGILAETPSQQTQLMMSQDSARRHERDGVESARQKTASNDGVEHLVNLSHANERLLTGLEERLRDLKIEQEEVEVTSPELELHKTKSNLADVVYVVDITDAESNEDLDAPLAQQQDSEPEEVEDEAEDLTRRVVEADTEEHCRKNIDRKPRCEDEDDTDDTECDSVNPRVTNASDDEADISRAGLASDSTIISSKGDPVSNEVNSEHDSDSEYEDNDDDGIDDDNAASPEDPDPSPPQSSSEDIKPPKIFRNSFQVPYDDTDASETSETEECSSSDGSAESFDPAVHQPLKTIAVNDADTQSSLSRTDDTVNTTSVPDVGNDITNVRHPLPFKDDTQDDEGGHTNVPTATKPARRVKRGPISFTRRRPQSGRDKAARVLEGLMRPMSRHNVVRR